MSSEAPVHSAALEGAPAPLHGRPTRARGGVRTISGAVWRSRIVRHSNSRAGRMAQYILLPLVVLTVWELVCLAELVRPISLPSPITVGKTLGGLAASGQLFVHIGASIVRVLEGFVVAATVGLVLGVAVGVSTTVERLTDMVVQILRPIPPIAWIPLAILWFGIGEASKVYIIFLGAFFPIVISVVEGIRQTDPKYVEVAKVLEVPWYRFVHKVVLPGALPSIITGLRVGLGTAWVCVVAAEMIAADRGVGYVIVDGRELSRADVVIAGMISIGVIGKLMDVLLKRLERRLIPWKTPYAGN